MATPSTPVITAPYSGNDFFTNRREVGFSGTTDVGGVSEILVTSTSGTVTVDYTPGSGVWQATVIGLEDGANTVSVQALSDDATPLPSVIETVIVTVADIVTSDQFVSPPTSLACDASLDSVIVTWRGNTEDDISGYNVYASFTPAGGTTGYTLLNASLITTPYLVSDKATTVSQTISQDGDTRVTTTTESIERIETFRYEITEIDGTELSAGVPVYIVITAVVFDSSTQQETESTFSGELPCSPLDIATLNIVIPTRPREQIVDSYVESITGVDQLIDIKPGTTTNDVHIQPPSNEFEKTYFLIDFAIRTQSFATLLPLDDSDGDGISDPVSESPYKQALQAALNNPTDEEVQDFIDSVFTAKARDVGEDRLGATAATSPYVFYRATRPQRDVEIPIGTVVSTEGNPAQGVFSQQYVTTTEVFVLESEVDNYFNLSRNRYEFPSFIQATIPGEDGNQDAGAIKIVNSGASVALQGVNLVALVNGSNEETNSRLATRIIAAKNGVDSSSDSGYVRAALSVPSVRGVEVVDADDCFMQRDWDPILRRHMKCMVDIYIKGQILQDCVDTPAFVYMSDTANSLTIIDAPTFTFEVDALTEELSVGDAAPIFEVTRVLNVTKSALYDVDCTRFNGAQFTLDSLNLTNVGIGLDPGDVVQADFRWKDSDQLILECQPVDTIVSVVGDRAGALAEGVNYFLNKSEDPLAKGNSTKSSDSVVIIPSPGAECVETTELNGGIPYELAGSPVFESSIVVTDTSGLTTYVLDVDYEVDTCQRVAFFSEEILADFTTAQNLKYPFVDESTVEVFLGVTPTALTLGVDYTLVTVGSVTGVRALAGGSLTPGDPLFVDYRVTQPIRLTEISRLVAPTPTTTIPDGSEVTITYNKEVPDGSVILTEAEEVTLVARIPAALSKKGVFTNSIVVTDPDGGPPAIYTLGLDYLIVEGDGDTPTFLVRIPSGSIPDGGVVAVEYLSSETYTITYRYNALLQEVQDVVNLTRNAGADVLVKGALLTPIDIALTVVPNAGVDSATLVGDIRVALANFFAGLALGENVYQNDIVRVVDCVEGVNHAVLPLLELVRAEGSLSVREEILNPEWSLWAEDVSKAFRTQAGALRFIPEAAGGSRYLPRGVFEDDHPLCIVNDISLVEEGFGRAYISNDGSIIVSPISQDPDLHTYTVTYQVGSSAGVTDIFASPLECLTLGTLDVVVSNPESESCNR